MIAILGAHEEIDLVQNAGELFAQTDGCCSHRLAITCDRPRRAQLFRTHPEALEDIALHGREVFDRREHAQHITHERLVHRRGHRAVPIRRQALDLAVHPTKKRDDIFLELDRAFGQRFSERRKRGPLIPVR